MLDGTGASVTSGETGRSPATVPLLVAIAEVPFVGLLASQALSPFLPSVASDLGTSVSLVGQVLAVVATLATAIGLVVGPVADAFGHRRVLLVGIAALSIGALGTALASTYTVLLLMAVFTALGLAIAVPVTQAIAGATYSGERRRQALSLSTAGASGSVIAGLPLLTLIAAGSGWRTALAWLGLLMLGSLGLGFLTLPPDRARLDRTPTPRVVLGAYLPVLRHRPTLGLFGWQFLNTASTWSLWTYFGAFLIQSYAVTGAQLGLAYTLVGIGIFAGSLATGGRLGRLPLWSLVVGTTPILGLFRATAVGLLPGPEATTALLTLAGLGTGILSVAGMTLLLEGSPGGRATTTTLNSAAGSAGRALGAAVGGLLIATGGYQLLALCPPIFGTAAAVCAWTSRPAGVRAAARPSERQGG